MKRLLILLLCVQIAGCANSAATFSTSTASASSAVGAQVTAAGGGAAAIALFALAAAMISASSESAAGTTTYNANPFAAVAPSSSRPPQLDVNRRVHEQDCTKPILDWSANLKCR